jgi:peptide/nickel transport system substrate-binding protein
MQVARRTMSAAAALMLGVMLVACGASKKSAEPSNGKQQSTTTEVTADTGSTTATTADNGTTTTVPGVASATTSTAKASTGVKTTATTKKSSTNPSFTVAARVQVTAPPSTVAPSEPPQPGGTITFSQNSEGFGYDTARFSTNAVTSDQPKLFAVYDALVYTDPSTGNVVPELATSMTTADAIVWTMKIRPDVKFTDGTAFDAAAVKFNWERLRDPSLAATGIGVVSSLTVDVVDSLTVKITLKAVNGQFPRLVADSVPFIGSPTAITAAGSQANYNTKPVGAGPFMLKQWVQGSQAILVRNPTYWNAPRPYLDSIIFTTITDETQRVNGMMAGQTDLAFTNNPLSISQLRTAGFTVMVTPSLNTNIFYMNLKDPALGDPRVRKALQLALDVDLLNKIVDSSVGEVPHTLFPAALPYSDPTLALPGPDLTKAQQLIDAYVNENGGKDINIEFMTTTTARNQLYFQAMKPLVEKLNHVKMTLLTVTSTVLQTRQGLGQFSVIMSGYFGGDPEPNFIERVKTAGSNNQSAYSNADVDNNVNLARSTSDANTRNTALKAIQKQVISDMPFFPLFRSQNYIAESSRVRDLATFNDGSLLSDRVWLKAR